MDADTKEAANHEALRHLLQDMESATRRQNRILAGFVVLLAIWSLAGLALFLKLDAMQFATNLVS